MFIFDPWMFLCFGRGAGRDWAGMGWDGMDEGEIGKIERCVYFLHAYLGTVQYRTILCSTSVAMLGSLTCCRVRCSAVRLALIVKRTRVGDGEYGSFLALSYVGLV